MNVIVNADDFGLSEKVTTAILESLRNGWVTQTTLMVNMPYADVAVERARQEYKADRIGLHLNFTEGEPLTEPIKKVVGICKDGRFVSHGLGNGYLSFSQDVQVAVRIEAEAQIKKYLSYGLSLMHCDGHHHVHNRLQFAYVVLPLFKKFGFRTVRNRYSIFTRPWIRSIHRRLPIGVFEALVRWYGLQTTEGFGDWNGETLERWQKFSSFEIMVHPNYDDKGNLVNVVDFDKIRGPSMELLAEKASSLIDFHI